MSSKKKILFVIDSLVAAGAEKSLVTLLGMLDYSKYEVDLQLFGYGGEFEQFLPKEVNLLPPLSYNKFVTKSLKKQIISFDFIKLYSRFESGIRLRKNNLNNRQKARIYWDSTKRSYKKTDMVYDVAIAYAQGIPTFYVADKVRAQKKLAWVNADLVLTGRDKKFQFPRYKKFERIIAVSDSSKKSFLKGISELESKVETVYDIIDENNILYLASQLPSLKLEKDSPYLITVSRLCNNSKGMDIALDACKKLKERGLNFRWYCFGTGDFKSQMEYFIKKNELSDYMKLMGRVSNPLPYVKDAAIYVCTSRAESFGISIAEARVLNVPVITTDFFGVYNQMVPNKNGIVVPLNDSEAVANAIEDLLLHPEKRKMISDYQKTEKKGNTEEFQKFLSLIEDN